MQINSSIRSIKKRQRALTPTDWVSICKPGDILFSCGQSWLSKAITFFGKLQTGDAICSHVGLCVGDGLIIEALVGQGIRVRDLDVYRKEKCEVWHLPMTDADRANLRSFALKLAGNTYGYSKLPLFVLDATVSMLLRRKVYFFTQKLGITSFMVCSEMVAYCLEKATTMRLLDNSHHPIPWRSMSPDLLLDLVSLPHNRCERIHKL